MASAHGFKRKCVIIDREFQFRYLMTWLLMTMALLAGLVLVSSTAFFVFKVRAVNHLVLANAICAVLITVLSMRYMILHSHRISGPAFRLERTIRELADGRFTGHIKLRRKDYLQRVAEALNYLYDRQAERARELNELRERAERISQALAAGRTYDTELRELTRQLREKLAPVPIVDPAQPDELEMPIRQL